MPEFRMPSLGADMEAGTLTQWYVKPGDVVHPGDTIATVETDKANIDVETFTGGVVDHLDVQPGAKVPVGTILAHILSAGETPQPHAAPAPAPTAARVLASPAARKLARERGIDLTTVCGSGPHGIIERADVERAAPAPPVAAAAPSPPPAPEAAPAPSLSGIRRAIAAAMTRSNREIPHYHLETRIDMHDALAHLTELNARRSVEERILPAALLLKAVAVALAQVPSLNGYWIDDAPQLKEGIHLGVAISLRQGGLVIPAIHDADEKSLDALMASLRDLIMRARAGRLKSSEVSDATITVTNLGDLGVESVHGVIYPPQLALVGFGRIADEPWALDGMIGARPILHATLAADHRATDGHVGAQFLTALARALADPRSL